MTKKNECKHKTKAITNGVLIDGTGSHPLQNGVVLVEEAKIVATGKESDVEIPKDAEIIDAGGNTIMPGMIELHAHMSYWWNWPGAELFDQAEAALLAAYNLKQSLDAGITTVRDVGTAWDVAFSVKRAMSRGLITGSRPLVCGQIICATGGHGTGLRGGIIECNGPWECRRVVRDQIKKGADHIKICTTDRPWTHREEFTMEELEAIADEAHRWGKPVAAHAALMPGLKMAVEAGIDTIEHGMSEMRDPPDDEVLGLMVKRGTIWVPTLWIFLREKSEEEKEWWDTLKKTVPPESLKKIEVQDKWFEDLKESAPKNFKEAVDAGVKIATGADVGITYPNTTFVAVPEEMKFMCDYGMSNMGAIVAATKTASEAIRMQKDLGTIEKGKLADIIVVKGNPLRAITSMKRALFVMKKGVIYKNQLQKQIR